MAGFVLVGGHSSRMGTDKARLPVDSRLLVEDIAHTVGQIAGSVMLVGASERYADLPFECLDDLRPGLGPLAGLEAALASGRGELNVIVSCDLPDLRREWLQHLLALARHSTASCAVLRDGTGRVHPLCAVYRLACLPPVTKALDRSELSMMALLRELPIAYLDVPIPIANVNTPEDWSDWNARHSRRMESEFVLP